MESFGGYGAELAQRLGSLVLGVAVTLAMTAPLMVGEVIGAIDRKLPTEGVRTELVRTTPASPITSLP